LVEKWCLRHSVSKDKKYRGFIAPEIRSGLDTQVIDGSCKFEPKEIFVLNIKTI
jgi:hypothetical protein